MARCIPSISAVLVLALACATAGLAGPPASTIALSGAWALYPMAVRWAAEFEKTHPGVRFDISAGGAGKGMTDVLTGVVDIGLVSREVHAAEFEKGALPIAVTRDAVVPMMNTGNPVRDALVRRGVPKGTLAAAWLENERLSWGGVTETAEKAPVHVYTRSDACGAGETWAAYLGGRQEDLAGIGVYGDPGLAEAVQRDPLGIGYNNVNYAYDPATGEPVARLQVLPIDLDANGTLDPDEDFYATRDDLMRAIGDGRYPAPPARDLYFVTRGVPARAEVRAFIRWVLAEGQAFVPESGYIRLPEERLAKERGRIE